MKLRYPLSAAALYAALCEAAQHIDRPEHAAGLALLAAFAIPAALIAWAHALEAQK